MKRICVFLVLVSVVFSLASCVSDDGTSSYSEPTVTSEESIEKNLLTIDVAKRLLAQDKKTIEIFVCGALCQFELAVAHQKVAEDSEFYNYSAVEEHLASTYSSLSGCGEFFKNYPLLHLPALKNENGKTKAYYFPKTQFSDFADLSSVKIENTEDENKTIIKLKTESGKEFSLSAVCENDKWLLAESLYSIYPTEEYTLNAPYSDMGSMSEFNGKVLIIELFISDSNGRITAEEENEFHQRISSASEFLLEQSKSYGGEVTVSYERLRFEHAGTVGSGDLAFDIFFGDTGFGTLQNMAETGVENLDEYDNYLFAVCFKKDVEPLYKVYENTSTTELYYGERLFVGTNTTELEILENMLYLSGYYDETFGNEYMTHYKKCFPNDVLDLKIFENAEITPFAAYCCGMTNELNPLFRSFVERINQFIESEE